MRLRAKLDEANTKVTKETAKVTEISSCPFSFYYFVPFVFASRVVSVLDYPHCPTGEEGSCCEEREAFGAVEDHVARSGALGNAEDDGSEEGKDNRGAEV